MKNLLFALLIFATTISYAQTNKKSEIKSSEIIVSCSAEYVEPRSIVIWWVESDHNFPTRVQDGFHNSVYLGQVASNAFTWDRGTNWARLDRYTGVLTLTPKDGTSPSTARCTKVDKKF